MQKMKEEKVGMKEKRLPRKKKRKKLEENVCVPNELSNKEEHKQYLREKYKFSGECRNDHPPICGGMYDIRSFDGQAG